MNSLRSTWEVVNPWSETQGTVRRMRKKARYLEALEREFEEGRMQAPQRDVLHAKNKVEFRATDAVRDDFRARVQGVLAFFAGNNPELQNIQCAQERDDEGQARGIASRVRSKIEYESTEGFFWNVTALDAIRWFGTRKTDDGEGEMMKSAAGKLERACRPRTFMTEARARARREKAAEQGNS